MLQPNANYNCFIVVGCEFDNTKGGVALMATVVRSKKDESNDSVIRRFKKQVLVDQVLTMIKKKDFYIKPSEVRKERKKEVKRNLKREKYLRRMGY